MSVATDLHRPAMQELLVGLYDLTNYTAISERTEPIALFTLMAGYTALAGGIVTEAGGTFIKPIGDAGLFCFPAEEADAGVQAALDLLERGDEWLGRHGYAGRGRVGLNLGPAAVGWLGAPGAERIDIIGKTVNIAAVLRGDRITMTPMVFRRLSPAMRKQFKKHTPPISYIGLTDRHPRGYWRGFQGDATSGSV
jgi:class 3 adenylate cyclase